jgi:hypothetical protein
MLVLAVKFSEACEFQGIVQQIAYKLLDAYWVGECRDGTISATKLKFNPKNSIRHQNKMLLVGWATWFPWPGGWIF